MLGQAHTPRRRLLPFVAIALTVLAAPAVGGANPSHSVATLRARDAEIAAKSRAAVLDLYSLDQQLSSADERLVQLHRQAATLRTERAVLNDQLRIARHGTLVAQRDLGLRLRELYEQGSVEPLEIVFGAKTLDEAMANIDNLNRANHQSEDVLAQLKLAKHQLAVTSHALASRTKALRQATSAALATLDSLSHARAARASYISSLTAQRNVTRRELAGLVAQAHAAQVRSSELARTHAVATVASPAPPVSVTTPSTPDTAAPVADGRAVTVSATGYALGGSTATGLPVGWGVVAVDPAVIPLGTRMTIPGYGEAVAADTGGAVIGNTIDLWFPSVAQANAWGRRTVTVVLH